MCYWPILGSSTEVAMWNADTCVEIDGSGSPCPVLQGPWDNACGLNAAKCCHLLYVRSNLKIKSKGKRPECGMWPLEGVSLLQGTVLMSHGSWSGCFSVLIWHNERDGLRGKRRDPVPQEGWEWKDEGTIGKKRPYSFWTISSHS